MIVQSPPGPGSAPGPVQHFTAYTPSDLEVSRLGEASPDGQEAQTPEPVALRIIMHYICFNTLSGSSVLR